MAKKMTITFDFEYPETAELIGNYISEMTTDAALGKAYKKMTGREMIDPDIPPSSIEAERGFDFMVNGGIVFNKFFLYRGG